MEHLTGTFTITRCDDGGVHPHKVALQEELVHCCCHAGPRAENCTEQIGARAQVRNSAQELGRMPLLLQRIIFRRAANQSNFNGLDFPFLLTGTFYKASQNADRRTGGHASYILIPGDSGICHHLNGGQTGTVIYLQKRKSL